MTDELKPTLAQAIRSKLTTKGWSQKELSRFLRKDEATISLWLNAAQTPRLKDERAIRLLAKFLQKTEQQVKKLIVFQKQRLNSIPTRSARPYKFDSFSRTMALLNHSLRQVTRAGLERFGDPNLVGDTPNIWREIARNEEARRAIEEIYARLEYSFDATLDDVLPKAALDSAVHEILGSFSEQVRTAVAEALRIQLLGLRILSEAEDGRLRRRWRGSSSFVLNSLFGIPLHIKGMNFLLDGGLVLPPGREGMIFHIQGKPGTGKSMFALQLASSVAAAGHLAVYMTAEETPNFLKEQLHYAGYREHIEGGLAKLRRSDAEFYVIQDAADITDGRTIGNTKGGEKRGVLLFTSPSGGNGFDGMLDRLRTILTPQLPEAPKSSIYTCCIVDSIDAFTDTDRRDVYRELFDFLRKKCDLGILVAETHEENQELFAREHLVDMILRLSYRADPDMTFKSRVVEIEKCRTQSIIRGEHRFSIHRGRGITVYPSVQALLSVWRRRTRHEANLDVVNWTVDNKLDLSKVLRRDVNNGAAMLLSGPPATHKTPLGLMFLASGLKDDPDSNCLLVSLREDPASLVRTIRTYPQLHLLLRDHESPVNNPRVKIRYVPPDYFTADRFLDWMRDELAERKIRKEGPFSRVLFNSISQLFYNSPMCRREPLLIPALIEMFKKEGITSLFIEVRDKSESEVQNIFDAIIFTAHGSSGNPNSITLRVGHSGPCNADRNFFKLDRVQESTSPTAPNHRNDSLDAQLAWLVLSEMNSNSSPVGESRNSAQPPGKLLPQ